MALRGEIDVSRLKLMAATEMKMKKNVVRVGFTVQG
jgi:hypothetical protein